MPEAEVSLETTDREVETPRVPYNCLTDQQVQHIESFGIPVDLSHPHTYWIGSIDRQSAMPTDAELRMIRSYIEYEIQARYNEQYRGKILAKRFPAEAGHVTKVFKKGSLWLHQENPFEGWLYRRGPFDGRYWPFWPAPRVSLIEVMDYLQTINPYPDPASSEEPHLLEAWVTWKADHMEIFCSP